MVCSWVSVPGDLQVFWGLYFGISRLLVVCFSFVFVSLWFVFVDSGVSFSDLSLLGI